MMTRALMKVSPIVYAALATAWLIFGYEALALFFSLLCLFEIANYHAYKMLNPHD